jgi:hypothetical protein
MKLSCFEWEINFMHEFFEERAREVRWLADMADPFTKIRLLKLAERYDRERGLGSKAVRRTSLPSIAIDLGER